MSSHWHDSSAGTQNQGNVLGARPCVRQSKLFRSYESGNGVKGLLGTPHLVWDETRQQGAYHNQPVWDHETGGGGYYSRASQQQHPAAAPEQQSNARTYERSSQAYGSGYDHLPPHYHQQHQRQQPPPPPSSGNSLLDDIDAKRARNMAERHASIEADRLDDLRVARESEQLRAEVDNEISNQRQREQLIAAREESLMRFMRQQSGGRQAPRRQDHSPTRQERMPANNGVRDERFYPRDDQRMNAQYRHSNQQHMNERGHPPAAVAPAHDSLKALRDYNIKMQGTLAPSWQPSAPQYGNPEPVARYAEPHAMRHMGDGSHYTSPGRSKKVMAHMAACRERAPPVPDYDGRSSNMWASNGSQNTGNFITDRPTTKVVAPPGGYSSINLFGGR